MKARSYAEEAVASSEQLQDHGLLMRSLHDLGEVAAAEGNDEAEALYERAIGVASEAGLPAASSIMNLGLFALARGDYARARTLMLQGLEMCRENQRVDGEAIALTNLGSIAFAEGNYRDAIASYADSLEIALRIGFAGILADGLLHLAAIAARGDSPTDALIILAAAETRLARASITLDATDRQTYETTRELLDARVEHERRAAARQTGAALSDADAAAQALAAANAAATAT